MASRSLARELLAERARKQKLNASDRAVMNLNRYYGSVLTHTIQDIAKDTRHRIYTVEYDRKNFLEERRKSLANIVLLESPQKVKNVKYFKRRKKSDSELMKILEMQEKRRDKMDIFKAEGFYDGGFIHDKAKPKNIRHGRFTERGHKKHQKLKASLENRKTYNVGLNSKPVLPPISDRTKLKPSATAEENVLEEIAEETDPLHKETAEANKDENSIRITEIGAIKVASSDMTKPEDHPSAIGDQLEPKPVKGDNLLLPDTSVSSKKHAPSPMIDSCRSLSTRRTSKSDPYKALFSSYLHPANYEDTSNGNLLYMLALNEEEIETYELKKKQDKLKRRLKNQNKNNGMIAFNAKEWMKRWDEERRAELVEEALRKAAEDEAREKRRKAKEAAKKSNFETDVYSSDEEA